MDYLVKSIEKLLINEWLLYKHYAHRCPSISFAFGLFKKGILQGVCSFGSPPSPPLCRGICGKEYSHIVLELNRLCVNDGLKKNGLSFFVSQSLKLLPTPRIIVSYADSSQYHHGYIYQATNFLYTGLSAKRTEWRMKNSNKHSKSICDKYTLKERKNNPNFFLAQRPQKHRYIMFIGNKTEKKNLLKALKYPIKPYPKGDNKNYDASYKIKGLLLNRKGKLK